MYSQFMLHGQKNIKLRPVYNKKKTNATKVNNFIQTYYCPFFTVTKS